MVGVSDEGYVLLPALAQMPGHLLWRAATRTRAALTTASPGAVTDHGFVVLHALGECGGLSQQELARATGVSRTTMASVAATLSAAGLVQRVRNPADRRSYVLTRTPAGAHAAVRHNARGSTPSEELTAGWTAADRAELVDLLRRSLGDDLPADVVPDRLGDIGFLVVRTHAVMHRELSDALTHLDIEPRHFGLLSILTAVGPITQSELSRYIGVSGPTAVVMIDDLEQRNLLERCSLPQDRRAHLLHLLPQAHQVLLAARRIVGKLEDERFAALSAAERERLTILLGRYVTE